jgi:hypothetical protein
MIKYAYFERHGRPYLAEVGSFLASNPPQYRVLDLKLNVYLSMFCHEVVKCDGYQELSKEDSDKILEKFINVYEYGG